jgi:redox-sensing transcriptional repressor
MQKGKEPANGPSDGATPKAAVGRLSLYLRHLEALQRAGQETISSTQLGRALEITDAQVRKDLTYFGQFGYPGVGYRVQELRDALRALFGTNRTWQVALVGAGNLGRALLGYRGFRSHGFAIGAVFDSDPKLHGKHLHGVEVYDVARLPELARTLGLALAVLAVPAESAQSAADIIVDAGIVGILNFAPVQLRVPDVVAVVSVDLGLQLEQLAFLVNQRTATSTADSPSTP